MMRTATRIAEGMSALVFLMFAGFNPHGDISVYLIFGIEAVAAIFVASTFPRRRSPVVALVLAVVALATNLGGLRSDGGGAGLHSPIMGLSALPFLVLVVAQIVAAVGAIGALRGNGEPSPSPSTND